ncbi:MAG: cytochrome c3 family protein [Deferrisomatales bacterium]
MIKRRLPIFLPILAASWWALLGGVGRAAITQPVAFNHKLHVEDNGLECVECHVYVRSQPFAGLPGVEKCLECHEEPQTDSAEEEKIRQTAEQGGELQWNRIYDVPDHVYYSHRRHVVAGGLECGECHGPIAESTSPPTRPLNEITMDFCIECHMERDVAMAGDGPGDCFSCHK